MRGVGLPVSQRLTASSSSARKESRPADGPGLNSGSSETDPNLRYLECLGQGCHYSTQSRVIEDGQAERARTCDWVLWGQGRAREMRWNIEIEC
jgi:hypothetical protein